MSSDTFMGLVHNVALLLALAVLYDALPPPTKARRWMRDILTGVLLGLIAMAVMLTPWRFSEGIVFDTRSILLSMTGLFFGSVPTVIAVLMTSALRIVQGGNGTFTGVAVILTSAGLGFAWRYSLRSRQKTPYWYSLYGFGVLVHVAMLLWMFTLPDTMALDVLRTISLPVMFIYPIGTVLLGLLLVRQRDRTQWQQRLRHERDLLARVSETSPVGITVVDQSGQVEYANARAEEILGLTRDRITQRIYNAPEWKITDWDGKPFPDAELPFRQVQATQEPVWNVIHAIEWANGRRVLLSINAAPLLDAAGHMEGMVASIEDITERKQAETSLQQLSARQQALLTAIPDIVMEVDRDKVYTWASPAGIEFFGEDVVGREAAYYFVGAQDTYGKMQPLFGGNEDVFYVESWQRRQDGEKRLLGWWCRVLRDGSGNVAGAISSARDITERKQAEEALRVALETANESRRALLSVTEDQSRAEAALRESEDRYQQIIRVAHGIAYDLDWVAGTYTFMESGIEQLVGYTPAEFTPPVFRASIVQAENDTGGPEQDETQTVPYRRADLLLRRKDGSTVWVMDCAVRIRNDRGDVVRTIGMLQNIDARKRAEHALYDALEEANQARRALLSVIEDQTQAERALRQSEAMLQKIFDLLPVGLWIADREGQVVRGNPAGARIWGVDLEAPIAEYHPLVARRLPSGQPILEEDWALRRSARTGETIVDELLEIEALDGQKRVILNHTAPVLDDQGNIQATIAVNQDITRRKQAEDALRESEERYRNLFEQSPDAIFILDTEGRHIDANRQAAELLGYTRRELLTRSVQDISAQLETSFRMHDRIMTDETVLPYEQFFHHRDGHLVPVELHVSAIRDQQGKPLHIQSIVRDITERKEAEKLRLIYTERLEALVAARTRALQEAQERLLRQERLTVLGQIAGGIAHELRTPLSAIKNAAYLLNLLLASAADSESEASIREAIEIVNREIDTSNRIITSLLNFARPQRPTRQKVDLREVVSYALSRIEVPPDVQVEQHIDGGLSRAPTIAADVDQLRQILGNLILNAIQAMPDGGRLAIETRSVPSPPPIAAPGFGPEPIDTQPDGLERDDGIDSDDREWIMLSISDTGTGVEEKHLAHLFEPLFTTKSSGMGLGLALVKLMTQANGGGIAVESELGQGTIFYTYWPITWKGFDHDTI